MGAEDWRDVAYSGMAFNSPLSEERADRLVERAARQGPTDILDLGCGWAELLLRILAASPESRGTGVDTDAKQLDRARRNAARHGLAGRTRFVEADAARWRTPADVVVVSGASHAFGGIVPLATSLRDLVRMDGLAVVGEAVLPSPPTDAARSLLGSLPTPDEVTTALTAAGFEVERAECATLQEWDDFEAAFRSNLETSAYPEHREFAAMRRREYEEEYRGVAGFSWVVARG